MDTEYKRKRVAKACQRCRSMKSKCDGQRPACSRCRGYGYTCAYRLQRPRLRAGTDDRFSHSISERLPDLCDAIHQQERLLDHVISLLPSGSEQEAVLLKSSSVKSQLDNAICSMKVEVLPHAVASESRSKSTPSSCVDRPPGYLGEVSDIRFVNLVKRFLQIQDGTAMTQKDFESYDQGENLVPSNEVPCPTILLPAFEEAKHYIDAYFTTIHIAYPFIPESPFIQIYKTIRDNDSPKAQSCNNIETALLYTICAIGAYYRTLPGKEESIDTLYEKLYSYALTLAPASNMERSLAQVSLLLARCFYLLVVCRTESCWTILGQAVRVAQSIGLHIESEESDNTKTTHSPEIEKRRRVWYSIYVLDRLLSLQLGRPPAIHDDDFNVPLPARASDSEIDWTGEGVEERSSNSPSSGDYFLAVIAFSAIVGRVLRSLYCPRRSHFASEDLLSTKDLDRQLIDWKISLPRALRFDLGHTFEQSYILKRQRNMLAIKYHHLRALIYRPYLCHPLLIHLGDPNATISQLDWPPIRAYERACISEARETARLLHGISSKEELVHGFPWWQMISCLVCASSILLVSSIFAESTLELSSEFDTAGLSDDAETCLKVFDALSVNSPGARIARDMMKTLKECGVRWKDASGGTPRDVQEGAKTFNNSPSFQSQLPHLNTIATSLYTGDYGQHMPISGNLMPTSCWPAEIVDSMAWSAQFFDFGHGRSSHTEGLGQAQHENNKDL
ncbi:fungal-specific transcription factor domain-containing protein [Trichoderma asperelloides]|nr:fungal-specific transcription factor domain-containing protein [Trichoderma asperelloides]